VSERERLERELEDCDAKRRKVDQRLRALQSEIAATTPLRPLETPEASEKLACDLRQEHELETEFSRLTGEWSRLKRELSRYR